MLRDAQMRHVRCLPRQQPPNATAVARHNCLRAVLFAATPAMLPLPEPMRRRHAAIAACRAPPR